MFATIKRKMEKDVSLVGHTQPRWAGGQRRGWVFMLRLGYCWVQRYRYITIRSSHDPVVEYHWWFVLTTNSDNCWFLSLASSVRSLVVRGWSRQWKWSSVPSEQDLNNYLNARLMICWQVNIITVSSSIGQWWSDSDCLIVCCDVVLRQGSSNSLTEEL
jgi:hypothetical protein